MKRGLLAIGLLFVMMVMVGQVMAQGRSGFDKEAFQKAMAAAKEVSFSGAVLSHDPMCHCLVVKTNKGDLTVLDDYANFMQDYDQAKGLKVGAEVKGVYKTVDHIHYLSSISYAAE